MQPISTANINEYHSTFNSYDGTAMFYRYWLTDKSEHVYDHDGDRDDLKIIVMLHRGHEHSQRLTDMAHAFVKQGYQVFAWDARGNGRSGGERDHAESFGQLVRDLDEFLKVIKAQTHTNDEQIVLIASSLGAVIASAYVHDYAPNIRGMILGTPALAIRLYVPFALPALKVAKKLGVMSRVSSYVKAQVLTHDKEAQSQYHADKLISSSISRDLLINSLQTGARLLDDAGAITTPTMILCAGQDYVVDKETIRTFYDRIRSPIKRWAYYPKSFHAIFHEVNKQDVFADCLAFTDELFASPPQTVDLTSAHNPTTHAQSFSKDKVDTLMAKGFNPSFVMTKFMIERFGHVSDGVSAGVTHGFDSGVSLDKVYQNEPRGKFGVGRLIDNFYLNNIGWRGIRIRKAHLLELAEITIDKHLNAHPNKQPIKLLDVASGNGYYAFELLHKYPTLTATLRDYDSHNVSVMKDKAVKQGLSSRAAISQQDAFCTDSYHSSDNDIAIVSGLFELFSDNTLIQTALSGMHRELSDGGYLLYTNQPWHPEQEFIGKTLNSHQGTDWVMRCRSQAEIDQLVAQAGFKRIDMRIDEFGIFSVSLAVKLPTQP